MSTVDENYKRLRAELDELLSKDKRLTVIADKIAKGAADFSDTARYTQIVSKHMSDVIKRNIGELKQPMAKEMVCKELLRDHYDLINGVFGEVQVSVDEKLGVHLDVKKPAYPAERVDKWAHSLEDPTVEQSVIERRAASGSENIGNSIHDDCIDVNAELRDQAGLDCYLTRDAGGGCCPWCQALEGRYNYADAPDDIFRRHDNCTCTVTYECGKMRQDVWSKESNWSKEQSQEYMSQHDAALAEKRKELRAKGVNVSNAKLNKKEIEAIKARIDASEAAKPTVNTPEQAKELEKQILEKNPVTKLTPEQAKAIDEQSKSNITVLSKEQAEALNEQHKAVAYTPEQAAKLEKQILEGNGQQNELLKGSSEIKFERVDGSGKISKELAEEYRKEYDRFVEQFGELTGLKGIDIAPYADDNVYGRYYPESRNIVIYGAGGKNGNQFLVQTAQEHKKSGEWSTGVKYHSFRHELGHALQDELASTDLNWSKKFEEIEKIRLRAVESLTNEDGSVNIKEMGTRLSKYGFTNTKDFISESVAEYVQNPKKARSISKQVVEILKRGDDYYVDVNT